MFIIIVIVITITIIIILIGICALGKRPDLKQVFRWAKTCLFFYVFIIIEWNDYIIIIKLTQSKVKAFQELTQIDDSWPL